MNKVKPKETAYSKEIITNFYLNSECICLMTNQ